MLNTMSLLRRQLVVVPVSLLLGFLVAYYSFKGALRQTAFGEPVHVGGGYNALGRIRPLNATEAAAVANEWGEEKGRKKEDEVVPDGMKVKDLAAAVENATLGFGRVFVINAPHDADRKDAMVLASAFSNLRFSWVGDASRDEVRATSSLSARDNDQTQTQNQNQDQSRNQSQEQKQPDQHPRSAWRAHINAIRATVEQDLSSSLILQDDLDWDIRLKEQMHTFALSTRTLTQPLASKAQAPSPYADPSFPDPSKSNKVTEIAYANRPTTLQPATSVYGDDWDILWLGHCKMAAPTQKTPNSSKARVVLVPDPTIPLGDIVTADGGSAENQTRLYHHVSEPECALAYAVSQRGARRILYDISRNAGTENIDRVLGRLCSGGGKEGETKMVCVTSQPSLFSRWRGSEKGSEHVRWSVRKNMGRRVKQGEMQGEMQWVDQYP